MIFINLSPEYTSISGISVSNPGLNVKLSFVVSSYTTFELVPSVFIILRTNPVGSNFSPLIYSVFVGGVHVQAYVTVFQIRLFSFNCYS